MKVTTFLCAIIILVTGQASGFKGVPQEYEISREHAVMHGMSIDGPKYIIGVDKVAGVKALAELYDIRKDMLACSINQTHHLMVTFEDIHTGEPIEFGTVALRVKVPDESLTETVKLLIMEGGFGADVTLNREGEYQFVLDSSLADGKARRFHLSFNNRL